MKFPRSVCLILFFCFEFRGFSFPRRNSQKESHYLSITSNNITNCSVVTESRFNLNFQIHVHVTLSHGEQFSYVHSPSALWVQSVTTRGLEVCIRESGILSNDSSVINWLAFEDRPGITHGSVSFNGYWTTETRCEKISFSQVRSNNQSRCG